MKIEYRGFRSESQRSEVELLIQKHKQILPKSLKRLFVINWDIPDKGEIVASIEYEPKYFVANLHIYNKFFADTEEIKEETIVHEFMHLYIARIRSLVLDNMVPYIEGHNNDLSVYMDRTYCELEENVVVELTDLLLERYSGSELD